jgi:hypothetical protein
MGWRKPVGIAVVFVLVALQYLYFVVRVRDGDVSPISLSKLRDHFGQWAAIGGGGAVTGEALLGNLAAFADAFHAVNRTALTGAGLDVVDAPVVLMPFDVHDPSFIDPLLRGSELSVGGGIWGECEPECSVFKKKKKKKKKKREHRFGHPLTTHHTTVCKHTTASPDQRQSFQGRMHRSADNV